MIVTVFLSVLSTFFVVFLGAVAFRLLKKSPRTASETVVSPPLGGMSEPFADPFQLATKIAALDIEIKTVRGVHDKELESLRGRMDALNTRYVRLRQAFEQMEVVEAETDEDTERAKAIAAVMGAAPAAPAPAPAPAAPQEGQQLGGVTRLHPSTASRAQRRA